VRVRVNIVGLSAGWWACVIGAANEMAWIGLLVVGAHLAIHLRLSGHLTHEMQLLLTAGGVGFLLDFILVSIGVLVFPTQAVLHTSPAWMVALWLNFATAMSTSLTYLRGHLLAATLVGGFGGPMAYWGGVQAGAIELALSELIWVAVEWGLALPFLSWLSVRLHGRPTEDSRIERAIV